MVATLCGVVVLGGGLASSLPAQAYSITPVSPPVASKTVGVTSWLNVRPDPSTAKPDIARLANGASVNVTGCVSNGWLEIKTASIAKGYVTAQYVNVPVVSVTAAKATVTLTAGATATTGYSIFPMCATNLKVTYASSNTKVLTVDATGKVTAIAAGTATVTVQTVDGAKKATTAYTVNAAGPVKATGVTLNKTTSTLVMGDTEKLTATVNPSDAAVKTVSWHSTDEKVVTVDKYGTVTAEGVGKAVIIVLTDDGNFTAACAYTVIAEAVKVTGVKLSTNAASLTVGQTLTLTATITPSDATYKTLTWDSSYPDVVKVDSTGKMTALKAGGSTVTVTTTSGVTDLCLVVVDAPKPNVVTAVTVSPSTVSIMAGKKATLKATVTPPTANQAVKWSSAKTTTATVTSAGVVTGKISGLGKSRSVAITAKTVSGGLTAKSTVQVYTTKDVQTRLNSMGCKDSAKKKLKVDGNFGASSVAALKHWQLSAGLPVNGSPNSTTLTMLFGTKTKCGTVMPTVAPKSVSITPASVSVMTTKTTTLTATVTPTGASQSVTWTSAKTTTAKVSKSGVVTGVVTGKGKSTSVVVTALTATGGLTAKSTVQVYTVEDVQTRLNLMGCTDAAGKKLVVDGQFGASSVAALNNWQKAAGLTKASIPNSAALITLFGKTINC